MKWLKLIRWVNNCVRFSVNQNKLKSNHRLIYITKHLLRVKKSNDILVITYLLVKTI